MLLHDYLDYYAREHSEVECAIQDDRALTYRQIFNRVNKLANAMIAAGLHIGDRLAFLSKNSIETVITYLAASKVGTVPVPLNWRLTPDEWSFIITDSSPKLIIAEEEFCSGIDTIRTELNTVKQYVFIGDSAKESWKRFDGWIKNYSTEFLSKNISEQDVLYQMYTSGTTGRPKGAMLTHRAALSVTAQIIPMFASYMKVGNRALVIMPMFHVGAISFVFGLLISGATMVIHSDYSVKALVNTLSNQNITIVNLVPTMIQAMLDEVSDLEERNFSNLKVIIYGASVIAEDTIQRAMKVFNCDFYQGYGQTESSAVISFLTAADHRSALTDPKLLLSAGRPVVGTSVRIVDKKGKEAIPGQSGEIVVRGPQLMKEYWNMPEETDRTIKDEWLFTGDVGRMDEDGYIYVEDRVKDIIITGGENVYPREIENVLFNHPAVVDAAVIGVPDDQWGEAILAVIVLSNKAALNEKELIAFCRMRLGGYKIPRLYQFVDEIPRNAAGKVLKRELRKPYWEGKKRQVS